MRRAIGDRSRSPARDRRKLAGHRPQHEVARRPRAHVDEPFHEAMEALGLIGDDVETPFALSRREALGLQAFGETHDRGERRAQLMCHRSEDGRAALFDARHERRTAYGMAQGFERLVAVAQLEDVPPAAHGDARVRTRSARSPLIRGWCTCSPLRGERVLHGASQPFGCHAEIRIGCLHAARRALGQQRDEPFSTGARGDKIALAQDGPHRGAQRSCRRSFVACRPLVDTAPRRERQKILYRAAAGRAACGHSRAVRPPMRPGRASARARGGDLL